jgi:malate dehydrogenase
MSVITAADVERARDVLVIAKNDVVTPLARDRAKELGVRLERSAVASSAKPNPPPVQRDRAAAANHSAPRRDAVAGLPPAVQRGARRTTEQTPEKSGTLYRRGGYGLDGRRNAANDGPAAPAIRTRPTVAVIGAGHVGAATGIRLAESNVFDRLILVDVVDGLAAGLALDMWHSAGLQRFTTRVTGSARLDDIGGADIVVITAGRPRKPGMTRTDLTAANAEIIREIAAVIRDRAPNAVVVVVTNPLEEMTHLTARITGFPPERVIGMGGVLDTARFRALVGLTGIAKPENVRAIVLGSHGSEMVIPLSQAGADGIPLEELLDAPTLAGIVQRTRESGAEVTGLLKAGSAYVSPGSAIARQVEAIARGSDEVVPACVASGGAYGLRDVRIGLPVRLGPRGVREIVALKLRPAELQALRDAAEQIRARTQTLA